MAGGDTCPPHAPLLPHQLFCWGLFSQFYLNLAVVFLHSSVPVPFGVPLAEELQALRSGTARTSDTAELHGLFHFGD